MDGEDRICGGGRGVGGASLGIGWEMDRETGRWVRGLDYLFHKIGMGMDKCFLCVCVPRVRFRK